MFSLKVEFLISLSALSRLLHGFPREGKDINDILSLKRDVTFPGDTSPGNVTSHSFTHPCTLCQTRVMYGYGLFLKGEKRCPPTQIV